MDDPGLQKVEGVGVTPWTLPPSQTQQAIMAVQGEISTLMAHIQEIIERLGEIEGLLLELSSSRPVRREGK